MRSDPVCLICLKIIKGSASTGVLPSSQNAFKRFILFSEIFLSLPEHAISTLKAGASGISTFNHHFCVDCEAVVGATCQLYQDLCAIQLKLGWRLKQLEELLQGPSQKLSSKLSSVLQQRVASHMKIPGGRDQVRNIRSHISKRCRIIRRSQTKEIEISVERIFNGPSKVPRDVGKCSTHMIKIEPPERVEDDQLLFPEGEEETFEDSCATDNYEENSVEMQEEKPDAESLAQRTLFTSKLRERKRQNYYTTIRKPKKIKVKVEKKEKMISHQCSKHPPDGRDPTERTCKICESHVSPSLKMLKMHMHQKHESIWRKKNKSRRRPPFQCHFCHWSFAFDQTLQLHLQLSSHRLCLTRGKYICSEGICDNLEFPNISQLNLHFDQVHSGEIVHRCELCNWPFVNPEMREVHELCHVKVRSGGSFKCPKCKGVEPTSLQALENHFVSSHTSLELKAYKCSRCGLQYKYQDWLNEHMKSHEMEMQLESGTATPADFLICQHCGKSCATKKLLRRHSLIMHKKYRKCSKCDALVKVGRMGNHLRTAHKDEHPPHLPCPTCGKTFYTQYKVSRHIRQIHEKVNKSKNTCHICGKEYQRGGGVLRKHLRDAHQIEVEDLERIHTKFLCTVCGKGYQYKASLEEHVEAKHTKDGERTWKVTCAICQKGFRRQCLLEKHMSLEHTSRNNNKDARLDGVSSSNQI